MKIHGPILAGLTLLAISTAKADPPIPESVEALWRDVDPRKEPLDVKVVRQWEQDGTVFRYVTFHIGTFKRKPARMAAFLGFPQGAKKVPGLVHLHGGGQRAFLHEVRFYAKRGYACLSINWGGRPMEEAKPDDANTDWGAVDPTQQNVPGYFNLEPGEKYLDPFESPRNNNWYLLTLGARRALTFLEQLPEVDADRLGVYGHSMGGNLTVYVAGTDDRVKVAAPSVGGQGFRTFPWPLLPQQKKHTPRGNVELFRATLGYQSYAPHITAPLLWLGATNDFHGIMDDTYRTGARIPHDAVRYAFTPHMNHRFTPEFAVTRPLWIDQHLKGRITFPATPSTELLLKTDDGVPILRVTPDASQAAERVDVLYSIDPDPQARFWRSAPAQREGGAWSANLPIMSVEQPLFAFANVHYRLTKPEPVPFAPPTDTFAISTLMHTATPAVLRNAGVKATDGPSLLIDDLSHGWRDWYSLSANNPHHWQYWTRRISDPKWRGPAGCRLAFDVKSEKPNELVVVMTENFFRPYRGKQADFVAVVPLHGSGAWEQVTLAAGDFESADDRAPLTTWTRADLLGLRAYFGRRGAAPQFGSVHWQGQQPKFRNLRWTAGKGSAPKFQATACDGVYRHHLQGICTNEKDAIYWSFTTALVMTDRRGKVLKTVPVANHHGDLCFHDGKLFVAVNLGRFNDPQGNAQSWVYVYDAKDLSLIAKHHTPQVFHGAGGIAYHNGKFIVVGGLPAGVEENYLYEYDGKFSFVKKHVLASGYTKLGIQTAGFADGRWWFGCYGHRLLVTDERFRLVGQHHFDCGLGIVGLGGGKFLIGRGGGTGERRTGKALIAREDKEMGLLMQPAASRQRGPSRSRN